jgi:hypothetical protein
MFGNKERLSYLWDMRQTPENITAMIAELGYGGVKKAIRASYWELYRLGYNAKEMKEALAREFGTADPMIRNFIYFEFH